MSSSCGSRAQEEVFVGGVDLEIAGVPS
jgi:hypothetical protein